MAPDYLDLSQHRADAVATYLRQRGVNGQRMPAAEFEEQCPIADNGTK